VFRIPLFGSTTPETLVLAVPAKEIVEVKMEVPDEVAVPDAAFLMSSVPEEEAVPNRTETRITWQGNGIPIKLGG
jgi:hypothetical protein